MMRSRAKYSIKNVQLYARDRPKRVWSIAWPVLSATAHVRYACSTLVNSYLCRTLWIDLQRLFGKSYPIWFWRKAVRMILAREWPQVLPCTCNGWHPGLQANRFPSQYHKHATSSHPGACCREQRWCRLVQQQCVSGWGTAWKCRQSWIPVRQDRMRLWDLLLRRRLQRHRMCGRQQCISWRGCSRCCGFYFCILGEMLVTNHAEAELGSRGDSEGAVCEQFQHLILIRYKLID